MASPLRRAGLLGAAALFVSIAGDAGQVRDSGRPVGRGRIAGVAVGRDGPVADALVTLTGTTWRRYTTTTDSAGQFAIAGLQADVYILTASKDEFLEAAYGATRPINRGGMPTAVALSDGQRIHALSLQLVRGGVITGVVRYADGRPAAETTVMVAAHHQPGMSGMARTDAVGAFRIAGLPTADYDVIAQPDTASVPVYHPGVIDPARAEPVRAIEDAPGRHIEFALVLAPPVRLGGVVRDVDGRPAAGVHVSATSITGLFIPTVTAADGRFVLDGVPPGRYRIDARLAGRSDDPAAMRTTAGRGRWAAAGIDVGSDPVTGIDLWLQPLMLFAGRVSLDTRASTRSLDSGDIRVFLTRPGFHPAEVKVAADGTFAHAAAPGLHVVDAIVTGSAVRLGSAMLGDRDLLDSPPVFEPAGGDIDDVVLTFTDRVTEISGRALRQDDAPISDGFVVVFPADRARWQTHSPRLAAARPATDGRFVVRNIPPGEYLIALVRDLAPDRWKTPEFLSAIAPDALKIVVVEGGRTVQDLRFQR